MDAAFAQFCVAAPADYDALRRYIDLCALRDRSYEFPGCAMPAGCVPERALLGFSRQRDGSYLLYWRPAVNYRGESRVLAVLFSRNIWRFPSFDALADRLCSLAREVEPAAAPQPGSGAAAGWPARYLRLADALGRAVLGQDRAVEAAAFRLYTHMEKREPARPLSLVLYGPTGVGKSELGKALPPALAQCGEQRYQFIWTDLNSYTQAHSVYRLTGAPPGYVGYEDQPVFEAVRKNPYTVFMFDELEKAHPEVLKVFMSILDEGRCTAHRADSNGERELDFRRCVFAFTTNADLSPASRRAVGFSASSPEIPQAPKKAATPAELAEQLFQENETARRAMVRNGVLAEIAGRFSSFIGFRALDPEARLAVAVKQIKTLGREYGLQIVQVDPATVRALEPGRDALSARSMVSVLEGMLAPLFSRAARSGQRDFRLSGAPGALQLVPAGAPISSTIPVSTFSL